jgi:hypothetical protein
MGHARVFQNAGSLESSTEELKSRDGKDKEEET